MTDKNLSIGTAKMYQYHIENIISIITSIYNLSMTALLDSCTFVCKFIQCTTHLSAKITNCNFGNDHWLLSADPNQSIIDYYIVYNRLIW